MLRILKVQGRTRSARDQRLALLCIWMEAAEWQLMDYSPELRSAAFERHPDAGSLSRFHPTRWLPGPDWHRPGVWFQSMGTVTRLGAVAGMVGLLMVGGMLGMLYLSHTGASLGLSTGTDTPEDPWHYVDASMLNVREHPLDNSQIVGVLYRNQRVEVKRITEGWAELVKPERGYVAAKFLKTHPVQ